MRRTSWQDPGLCPQSSAWWTSSQWCQGTWGWRRRHQHLQGGGHRRWLGAATSYWGRTLPDSFLVIFWSLFFTVKSCTKLNLLCTTWHFLSVRQLEYFSLTSWSQKECHFEKIQQEHLCDKVMRENGWSLQQTKLLVLISISPSFLLPKLGMSRIIIAIEFKNYGNQRKFYWSHKYI